MLQNFSTRVLLVLAFSFFMIPGLYAGDVTLIGNLQHSLKQAAPKLSTQNQKVIQLMQVRLSDEERNRLVAAVKALSLKKSLAPTAENALTLATKKQLGMNNVPVLDQGMHGTCVSFSLTAAMDALLAKGDYISQLCNLQLGSYLEKHGYSYSGWEGSFAITVINQMEQYGIVNKANQRKFGCGGLTEYPTYAKHDPDSFMEPAAFHNMSELVFGNYVTWSDVFKKNEPVNTLNEIKQSLSSGDRLVFAVLLPRTDLGLAGAVGKYKTNLSQDSWVLTPEVLSGVEKIEAAHEMIITGYDDNAKATDNHGVTHQGLLTLRNSWGSEYGDYGEFYMSYDYFKLLAFDLTRLSKP